MSICKCIKYNFIIVFSKRNPTWHFRVDVFNFVLLSAFWYLIRESELYTLSRTWKCAYLYKTCDTTLQRRNSSFKHFGEIGIKNRYFTRCSTYNKTSWQGISKRFNVNNLNLVLIKRRWRFLFYLIYPTLKLNVPVVYHRIMLWKVANVQHTVNHSLLQQTERF